MNINSFAHQTPYGSPVAKPHALHPLCSENTLCRVFRIHFGYVNLSLQARFRIDVGSCTSSVVGFADKVKFLPQVLGDEIYKAYENETGCEYSILHTNDEVCGKVERPVLKHPHDDPECS